ncbi:MAG: hypothetical protein IKT50_00690 [Clostridia bacterium]|nr:hypothetical protein [Clostridia bacterium]
MAIFENLTKEQAAAFEGCKSKEEIAANILCAPTGEIDDDALDAVAGGKNTQKQETNSSGYLVVAKNNQCVCGKYETATYPIASNTEKGNRCGTCVHCKEIGKAVGSDLCCTAIKLN